MNKFNLNNNGIRFLYPLFLIILPLIGMYFTDAIKWSVSDFIIMGILILSVSIGIKFILIKTKKIKNRIIYILVLLLLFILVWAELAVGVLGTPFAGN